ncbi:MAG: hypothetical protein ABWY11_13045 [Umezawaea sp.]
MTSSTSTPLDLAPFPNTVRASAVTDVVLAYNLAPRTPGSEGPDAAVLLRALDHGCARLAAHCENAFQLLPSLRAWSEFATGNLDTAIDALEVDGVRADRAPRLRTWPPVPLDDLVAFRDAEPVDLAVFSSAIERVFTSGHAMAGVFDLWNRDFADRHHPLGGTGSHRVLDNLVTLREVVADVPECWKTTVLALSDEAVALGELARERLVAVHRFR